MTTASIDQVKIDRNDELVRCGPALFTPFGSELEVRFLDRGTEPEIVKYDLSSIPFNEACLLHDGRGRATPYLVCNQWGTLHVRHGDVAGGKHYPGLFALRGVKRIRLIDDLLRAPHAKSWAMHPNPAIPFVVKLMQDKIAIELLDGGICAWRTELKLRSVPWSRWLTPTDKHRRPLPLRLRRPLLASMIDHRSVDLEWLD